MQEEIKMIDYEHLSASEVQRLARQGDKDAIYEMVWRLELLPADDRNNPVEQCAWQDYWYDKAANAGVVEAKLRYALSLVDRLMDPDDRQKAMRLFQSLSADFDAGKLSNDEREDGKTAKLRLGIMLCEGYGTWRDAIEGVKLIEEAERLTNGFDGFGFGMMKRLGELYGQGLVQPGEEATIADLEKSKKYLETAQQRFNHEKNRKEDLDFNNWYLAGIKKRIQCKRDGDVGKISPMEAAERRRKMMELSEMSKQRVAADKAALKRLSECLAREGW